VRTATEHVDTTTWSARADRLQDSVTALFGAPWPQYLHNAVTLDAAGQVVDAGDDGTFNYWWLAHLMDVQLDAFTRTGDRARLDEAVRTHRNIVERNGGSLFNDYFDDMLWFALATLRLHEATGDRQYLDDTVALWDHVVEHGWNDAGGASLAWRKQQLEYKNTPANGPLAILGARLHRLSTQTDGPLGHGPSASGPSVSEPSVGGTSASGLEARPAYLTHARQAFGWLTDTLVDPTDGFVEDGINREGDGRVDTQWRFTYNQGLYVGAAVELADVLEEPAFLDVAVRTALTAIDELSDGTVFVAEGDGGDEGLFKGVYYRYAGQLVDALPSDSAARSRIMAFVERSTDALWASSGAGVDVRSAAGTESPVLLGNDWSTPPAGTIAYSTELSGVMAVELRARLDR
jgi:predicted alpha-1,6-mannanase (GH76 family)